MKTVYLETTVPSYLVARPVRDIVILAHQEITRFWWATRRSNYKLVISQPVLDECGEGDPEAASQRLALIRNLFMLSKTVEVEDLAVRYSKELGIPARAATDEAHLAYACVYRVDYLVTWNCKHIANA
ncbi:MAG: type II toxin-antitoxin system VapC family toxin [Candidatus Hydrogenedentota bacterium]